MGQLARQHVGVVRRLGEPGVCLRVTVLAGWVWRVGFLRPRCGLCSQALRPRCPVLGAPHSLHTRDP